MDALARWYLASHRDLPWRRTTDPYRIWVSEVMLQQTRVETVLPYYARFLERFPTIPALAAADGQDVLAAWEGLGYYARGRNLHRGAMWLAGRCGGRFPDDAGAIAALPGVGRSTAAAIASIAFGARLAVLDGNVRRVVARLLDRHGDPRAPAADRALWAEAERRVAAAADPAVHNQAMMELGATLCRPRDPGCGDCPLAADCLSRARGTTAAVPGRRTPRAVPHHDVGVAILAHDGRVLVQRRPPEGLLGGLWEFPGGRREPGEALADTVRREVREELGVEVEVGEPVAVIRHAYTHFRVTLHAYRCRLAAGQAPPAESPDRRWLPPDALGTLPFPRANRRIIESLASGPAGS